MNELKQYWLSFTDPDKELGFLGVIILYAYNKEHAIEISHKMKLNPGGEVLILEIPKEEIIADEFCEKLLNREDLKNFGSEVFI